MRKLPLIVLFLVAACATDASVADVPASLRGCWIEHRGTDAVTMRWFPKGERALGWHGDQLFYHDGDDPAHQGYDVDPSDAGDESASAWTICPLDDGLPHGPPCMPVWFGRGHVVGDVTEWMELEARGDRLTMTYVTGGERYVHFNGQRDGCD